MGVVLPSDLEAMFPQTGTGEIPVPLSRKALPALFASRDYRAGAEIGVWHGQFSAALCQANPHLKLLCVDSWTFFHGHINTKTFYKSPQGMRDAEAAARQRLAPFGCDIRKGQSVDVAQTVSDGSLDFVYIDADHSYRAVLEDLRAWSPKVRSGGVISGHDYRVEPAKPFIQVIDAVKTFVAEAGIDRWYVLNTERTPSFLWVNP